MLILTVDVNFEDLLDFNRYFLKSDSLTQKSVKRITFLGPLIFFGMIGLNMMLSRKFDLSLVIFVALLNVAWIILVPRLFRKMTLMMVKKMARQPKNANIFGKKEFCFSEEKWEVKSDSAQTVYQWDGLVKWGESERSLFLFVAENQANILPKRNLSPEQIEALREMLSAKSLRINSK